MLRFLLMLVLPVTLKAQTVNTASINELLNDSTALFGKANNVQFADYTPKPGKPGKDVGFVIELVTLGALNKQGKDGRDGPDLIITIKASTVYSQKVLLVSIPNPKTGLTDSFYVNPNKGQLKIIADGADGGAGGTSEKGIKGDPGKAGKGGSFEVLLDSSAAAFIRCKCLLFSNKDGVGRDKQPGVTDEVYLGSGELLRPYDKPVVWKLVK